MPQLQYNTEAIASASQTIGTRAAQLEQEITSFFALANGLSGSPDWSGPSAVAFKNNATDWNARATRLTEALQAIQLAVGKTGTNVAQTDATNASMF